MFRKGPGEDYHAAKEKALAIEPAARCRVALNGGVRHFRIHVGDEDAGCGAASAREAWNRYLGRLEARAALTALKGKLAHVEIDYDEDDPASYRGVSVTGKGGEIARFATGDPEADWKAYLAWREDNLPLARSMLETSSVTHFLQDVPGWRMVADERGREIIVPEDRPGFEDRFGGVVPEAGPGSP